MNNTFEWTEYEINKLCELKKDSQSYSNIELEFDKDTNCISRTKKSIQRKWDKIKYQYEDIIPPKKVKQKVEVKDERKIYSSEFIDEVIEYIIGNCKRKNFISLEQIAYTFDVPDTYPEFVVNEANTKSIPLRINCGLVYYNKNYNNVIQLSEIKEFETIDTNKFSVGIVSDTHLGSKACKIKELNTFYQYLKNNNIKYCLHAGDWVDGIGIYSGQEFEQDYIGFGKQSEFFIENYPKVDGITTIGISGNHDYSFISKAGVDILHYITLERPDIVDLGVYQGIVKINDIVFKLHHPDGGNSYAISYKLQKILETLDAGINVFIMGHFHQNCILHGYKTDIALMPGSFQGETSFSTRKGLRNIVGGYILDINKTNKGIEYSTRWLKL